MYSENYVILGILCYLNHPVYLQNCNIRCVQDIFDIIEEKIEDLEFQICELESYYKLIHNENDKNIFLAKINNIKKQTSDMKNQLNFVKK